MTVNRYFSEDGLERALEQGRTVEQWLGVRKEGEDGVLKWLSLERTRQGQTVLRVCEVLDDGNSQLLDVYEFTPYDPDAQFGVVTAFDSAQGALQHAIANLGANPGRFMGQGGVQDEYADYLKGKE